MTIKVDGSHYNFTLQVDDQFAIIELEAGWWNVSDGHGNQVIPPFRRHDTITAIALVLRHLKVGSK